MRSIQNEAFAQEHAYLSKQNTRMGPLVKQLELFLDAHGIIRKGSRMENARLYVV